MTKYEILYKKQINNFIRIVLLFCTLTLIFTSCKAPNNIPAKSTIVLTKNNFDDFFSIDIKSDINIIKHGGTYILGQYIPTTYTADANVDINVFSNAPIDAYNVIVTLKVGTGRTFWNSETVALKLSSTGDATKNLFITSAEEYVTLFDSDFQNSSFDARIISVEGSIKAK